MEIRSKTKVVNIDVTSVTNEHGKIDDYALRAVVNRILADLNKKENRIIKSLFMFFSVRKVALGSLYIIAIIMVYPTLLYFLQDYKVIYNYLPLLPLHSYIQVFLSGPILIVLGAILFFAYKQRIFGLCIFLIGVLWIGAIFHELITKN